MQGGVGVKRGVLGPSNEKWKRERAVAGVGKVRGRSKVGGKKEANKKPPSKFDMARIIADEVP